MSSITCSKCGINLPSFGAKFSHEGICNGSNTSNNSNVASRVAPVKRKITCSKCGIELQTLGMKFNHEPQCKGNSEPVIQKPPTSTLLKCIKCGIEFSTFTQKYSHEFNCKGAIPTTSTPIRNDPPPTQPTPIKNIPPPNTRNNPPPKQQRPIKNIIPPITKNTPINSRSVEMISSPKSTPTTEKENIETKKKIPKEILSKRDISLTNRAIQGKSTILFVHLGSLLSGGIKNALAHNLIYSPIKNLTVAIVFVGFNRKLADSPKCQCCQSNLKKIKYTHFESKVFLKTKISVNDFFDKCSVPSTAQKCFIYDSERIGDTKEISNIKKIKSFSFLDLSSKKNTLNVQKEKNFLSETSTVPFDLEECLNYLKKTKQFKRKTFTVHNDLAISYNFNDDQNEFTEKKHLDKIVDKTKEWIERQSGLPKAKQTFKNSIFPICIVKENVRGEAILKKLLEENWIEKCLVCLNYDYTPLKKKSNEKKKTNNFLFSWEKQTNMNLNSKTVSKNASSELETVFDKVLYWVKTEPNLPSNVTAIVKQLSSFQVKRVVDPENVVRVLSEQKRVIVDPYEYSDILILKSGQEIPDYWLMEQSKKANKISSISSNIIPQYTKEKFLSLRDCSEFTPMLCHQLQSSLRESGYNKLTEIQNQVFPAIVTGKHCLFQSSGGSGKTGAFLIPIVERLERQLMQEKERQITHERIMDKKICRVIVLTSSLFLASQIEEEFKKITCRTALKCYVAKGESNLGEDSFALRSGEIDVVISVPSVIRELVSRSIVKTKEVLHCIIDEADLLSNAIFIDDLKEILSSLLIHQNQRVCQFVFSSTTLHRAKKKRIQKLMNEIVRDSHSFISDNSSNSEEKNSELESDSFSLIEYNLREREELISNQVSHLSVTSKQTEKAKILSSILEKGIVSIVYLSTLNQANYIQTYLSKSASSEKVVTFSDKLKPNEQNEIIESFKEGKITMILSCGNSVFERGFDFPQISLVVNFDLPPTTEDYINRCGRVSRVTNRKGASLTLLTNGEDKYLERLTHSLVLTCSDIPSNEIFEHL